MKLLNYTFLLPIFLFCFSLNLRAQSEVNVEKSKKPISKFNYSFQVGALIHDALTEDVGIDLTLNIDYSIRTALGYQISPKVSVGIMTGLDEYPNTVLIPVGLFADSKLGKSKVRWYSRINSGYAFESSDAELRDGGLFINFETGIWIKTSRKGNMTLTLGHYRQRANQMLRDVYRYPGFGDLFQEFSYRRVVFNIGYNTRI